MKKALCLSGHLRDLYKTKHHYEGDVFMATWDYTDVDMKKVVSLDFSDKTAVECYKTALSIYKEKYAKINQYRTFEGNFHKNRNGWDSYCLFHIMKKVWELKKSYEINNNFVYDMVVRCRPDYVFCGLPDIQPEPNVLYFPENANFKGITDNCVMGDSKTMDKFFLICDLLDMYLLKENCSWVAEHLIHHHLVSCHIKTVNVSGFKYRCSDGTPAGGDQAPVEFPND
jgi:hypothetical protein